MCSTLLEDISDVVYTRTSRNAVAPVGKYLFVFSLALRRVLGVADLLVLLLALSHELGLAHLLEGFLALLSELGVAVILVHLLAHLRNSVTGEHDSLVYRHLFICCFTLRNDLFSPDDVALLGLSLENLLETFSEP